MQGARSIALQTLSFFDANGYISFRKLDIALSTLSSQDRSFCMNIIYGCLRKRVSIDFELSRFLTKPSKLPHAVLNALRIGAFQILYMKSIPEYAALKSSVDMIVVKEFKGLVNAVLRKLINGGPAKRKPLNILYSHPEWLVNYWREFAWIDDFEEFLEHNQTPPVQTVLSLGRENELIKNGFIFDKSEYSDLSCVFQKGSSIENLQIIDEIEYLLSKTAIPVLTHKGSLTGKINSMPWLLHTLTPEKIDGYSKVAVESLGNFSREHNEFIYYSQAFTVEENKHALDVLEGFEPVMMEDFFAEHKISARFDGKGYWLQPWKAPATCYLARVRSAN
ncbi:transcription antitermination factor NusB [Mesotoga prima]|uniref:transcription antitermination factor NusB n=1 Tax=Mesotoga prima TaxID=1184387 RepID=UPI002CAEB9DB|nr:transcription antitermination factor NusB [Mesotoga prima]HUM21785.1 transcription antitermination factor NusB [Mesotoga prima]